MNRREAAIVSAYTGVLIGEFSDMHKYVEEIMGRPVWTHEMAIKKIVEEIEGKARPDFLRLHETLEDA